LPLVKPPWGRITAIDLNTGDHAWMIPNGSAPDYVKNHPAMKGIDLSKAGRPSRSPLMVTKTLLFGADGANFFNAVPGGGGNTFRAIDKKTGEIIHEMQLPGMATGIPMTYMKDGRQYIVGSRGDDGCPCEAGRASAAVRKRRREHPRRVRVLYHGLGMNRRTFMQHCLGAGLAVNSAVAALPKAKITRVRYYKAPTDAAGRPNTKQPLFNQSSNIVVIDTDAGLSGVGEGRGTRHDGAVRQHAHR
jgi:hypothetical protein